MSRWMIMLPRQHGRSVFADWLTDKINRGYDSLVPYIVHEMTWGVPCGPTLSMVEVWEQTQSCSRTLSVPSFISVTEHSIDEEYIDSWPRENSHLKSTITVSDDERLDMFSKEDEDEESI